MTIHTFSFSAEAHSQGTKPVRTADRARQRGFSLLEITIVLVIVGLLLVSGITSFSTQQKKDRRQKTEIQLNSIQNALVWYAASSGRLPCPDTDLDGMGNDDGSSCTALVGVFPWKELDAPNIKGLDAWGHYFTYHIGEAYSLTTIETDTGTNADTNCVIASNNHCVIRVDDAGGTGVGINIPAVVVSHGKNGEGHYQLNTVPLARVPAVVTDIANLPERENADGVEENADAGEELVYIQDAGDDMLLWISPAAVKSPL